MKEKMNPLWVLAPVALCYSLSLAFPIYLSYLKVVVFIVREFLCLIDTTF